MAPEAVRHALILERRLSHARFALRVKYEGGRGVAAERSMPRRVRNEFAFEGAGLGRPILNCSSRPINSPRSLPYNGNSLGFT